MSIVSTATSQRENVASCMNTLINQPINEANEESNVVPDSYCSFSCRVSENHDTNMKHRFNTAFLLSTTTENITFQRECEAETGHGERVYSHTST